MNFLPLLPLKLRTLTLKTHIWDDVSPVTGFSGLPKLEISVGAPAERLLASLTSLRNLRCLTLSCGFMPMGVVKTFTHLTKLTFDFFW
jgi:hypothetical protein